MAFLDPSRFIYSLAGEWLAGDWTIEPLGKAALRFMPNHALRARLLVRKILAAFPAKPAFAQLVAFLREQPALTPVMTRQPDIRSLARQQLSAPRRPSMDSPPLRLRDLTIPKLSTEAELAQWFGTDIQHLRWRADATGRNRKHPPGPLRQYRYRWIPKRHGLPRLLEIPKGQLKQMQRRILAEILNRIPVHAAAHGFRAARSIVTNAASHCGKATVLRFDLADFFASITYARVFRIFRTIGYPATVARPLAALCTTCLPADIWTARPNARAGADFPIRQRLITRHLPQGAPTSPALANLAAHRLDRRLAGLANAVGATYTRYADDLTLSGTRDLARSARRLEVLVAVIAHGEGFALNHRKTRIMRRGIRQKVTGVVVNTHPNIPRREFDRLKAVLTNCIHHGPASQNRASLPDFRAYLLGNLAHVRAVNPTRGEKLQTLFRRISWSEKLPA